MSDSFDAGKFGAIVPIVLNAVNATTNQTNTDMIFATGATLSVMPAAGSVVGISVGTSANCTAGSATFRAHSAGTEIAITGYPAPVIDATNSNASYATVRPGAITFSAGARLGVSYTSTTDMAPTDSNDFVAVLWVQLNAT